MKRVLLPFPAQAALAAALADPLGARVGRLDWRRFPDGESLVAIDTELGDTDVAIVCSLHRPDEHALALRFAADTAREFGARSVGLIAPYLGYLRQDARFAEGQALSAQLFARFLDASFDWLVTVDPHLHRIPSLAGLFAIPTQRVTAGAAVADWLRAQVPDAVLVGPDAESEQWVSEIAARAGLPWQVLEKARRGDREVVVSVPAPLPPGRRVVLVDDIASTGRTLLAALACVGNGERPPVCIVTHAVFAEDAYERLRATGARVVSTDTIPHESNGISIAASLATAAAACFSADEAEAEDAADWFDGESAS
jgi:ribose-phosphate pyrophosphokinase